MSITSYFQSPSANRKKLEDPKKNDEGEVTIPWVEKYRPKKVDDVVSQEEVVRLLKQCLKGADLPNLLFYGPPGTGKTSAALALCRQLFRTTQVYKDRVLELNASDERGIDVVRNRIKDFARIAITTSEKSRKDALVPLKIVILDEADAMTGAAQSALRRTMESETQTTRFFLICNYITRIIEPLTSRCAKYRFKPLPKDIQKERLLMIADAEGVDLKPDSIDELVSISGGDLRKSITLMQSMACSGQPVTVDEVREMSGQIPNAEVTTLIQVANTMDHKAIRSAVKNLVQKGYSVNLLLSQLADEILKNGTLNAKHKAKIFNKIAESERQLLEGAEEYLQLLDLIMTFQGCFMEATE